MNRRKHVAGMGLESLLAQRAIWGRKFDLSQSRDNGAVGNRRMADDRPSSVPRRPFLRSNRPEQRASLAKWELEEYRKRVTACHGGIPP